jgi:hypothetical protein
VTVLNFSVSLRVLLFQILWCGFGWRVASEDSNDRNQPNLLRIPWVRYSVNGFLLPQLVRGLLVSEYPQLALQSASSPCLALLRKRCMASVREVNWRTRSSARAVA